MSKASFNIHESWNYEAEQALFCDFEGVLSTGAVVFDMVSPMTWLSNIGLWQVWLRGLARDDNFCR